MDDEEYGYTKEKVLELVSINLDNYKEKQMRRRLASHIERNNAPDAYSYFDSVSNNTRMLQALKDFLTINVSEFFRDAYQFNHLENEIMPELLKRSPRLKIWSAGCSNGSEPYSLAMILADLTPTVTHEIVATDIDDTILSRARTGGPFSSQDIKNATPERLDRYFKKDNYNYQVIDSIRERIEFKRHNLLDDPYEKGFDLILCRNVVIYFTDLAKMQMNKQFGESLKENGVLFVGGSEIIFNPGQFGLETIIPAFYRKRKTSPISPQGRHK